MRYLRRFLLVLAVLAVIGTGIIFWLRAHNIFFTRGPHRVVASDDIIWLLPWESGTYQEGTGFDYTGTSVDASEHEGVLRVGGRFYGTVRIGDSVDLTTRGVVRVNGKVRAAR